MWRIYEPLIGEFLPGEYMTEADAEAQITQGQSVLTRCVEHPDEPETTCPYVHEED